MNTEALEVSLVPPCPVCGADEACSHFLIGIDLTFMDARGPLADAFLCTFARLMERAPEADKWDSFRRLTDHVRQLSPFGNEYVEEGGPGMTSLVVDLYASGPEEFGGIENQLSALAAGF
jgi:hypothetical protein